MRISSALKLCGALLTAALITGCVSSIPFEQQLPQPAYQNDDSVLITVIDNRTRVQKGKPRDFIGVAHGSFGIPFDWSVPQVLAVADGDKERDLAAFLEHRLSSGLQQKGWQVKTVKMDHTPSAAEAESALKQANAKTLLALELKEWYFSINLNWVSDFNFDTDTNVHVYQLDNGEVLSTNIAERDVIVQKASDSPQNNILIAYREQLRQIVDDPQVRGALAKQ